MDPINSFFGEYRFLSNFYPAKVELDGVDYPSVEHAYQAAKTLDKQKRIECLEMSAGQVKRWGKTLDMRPDWNKVKWNTMMYLVSQKFINHPDLGVLLDATGDRELVEGNTWGDTYWGVYNGKGSNHLGQILMTIRTARYFDSLIRGQA